MSRFEGKVAIVTGSGTGLGKSYVKALCKEGASVVIAEFNDELGKACESELSEMGYKVTFIKANVADEENIKSMVDETVAKYGRIDILINNAQATDKNALPTLVENTSVELMKLCWTTGALGTFFVTKYVVPHMKKQGYGRIVNTASGTGVKGMETFAAYGSQKEAIRGLTRVCATELGAFGVTCNVICPGALTEASKLWKEAAPDDYAAAVANQPIKRLGDPETDIAPVVMFLVSEEAQYITGQTIGVDGGSTMMP